MSVPVIAFFNNKGGVGKTSLVYHIAWMMSDLGHRVLAVDIDPQCNLTAAFIDEDDLGSLWSSDDNQKTIFDAVLPLIKGTGDISAPYLQEQTYNLAVIPGDMALSSFEDDLSQEWPKCLEGRERSFRIISAFWRILQKGAEEHKSQFILMDLGPNLGSINRAALIASDFVVIPLGPDLFSIQGLENLGPTLREWRQGWEDRKNKNPHLGFQLPLGRMKPIGYIVMQHTIRSNRPVKSYERWIARIPATYRRSILKENNEGTTKVIDDENCLTLLKHYRSLMPMAQEARKPIFHLQAADGAIGAHSYSVRDAHRDFKVVTEKIIGIVNEKTHQSPS